MQTAQYILSQDRLSTGGSFNICDTNARGFPMIYASRGFADLFGYTAAECVGVPCGSLVAAPSIRRHNPELRGLADALGMAPERVAESLEILNQHARQEVEYMMARPKEHVHVRVVNRKKSGDLFVCEVIMLAYEHPTLGWKFSMGLQADITADVSVRALLDMALAGEHIELHRARGPVVGRRVASLDVRSGTVRQYLAEKATEVWLAFMTDKLRSGPPQTPTKARISERWGTASTKSPTGTTSGATSDDDESSARELVGKWHATVNGLEQVLDIFEDHSLQIEAMGQVARGTFEYEDAHWPHHLNIQMRPLGGGIPMPDTLACIARVEGDVLHFGCPHLGMERPSEFGGPGYFMMTRSDDLAPLLQQHQVALGLGVAA